MIGTSIPQRTQAVSALRALMLCDTVALLFAGIVHLIGAHIPLGVAVFDEPPILPAGIVEGLAGLLFALAAYVVLARRAWAWPLALAAHLFAIVGFLVGIVATRNGTTAFNHVYHVVMLAVFLVGLVLLWLPGARAIMAARR